MTKKNTSVFKMITTMAFAMILTLSLALPSYASNLITWEDENFGTPNKSAEAGLTKILVMPVETIFPATISFDFSFTPKSFNGDESDKNMPVIGTGGVVTVTFTSADDPTAVNGAKTAIKESGDLLGNLNWTRPGVYVYTVTETTTSKVTVDPLTGVKEELTVSPAVYDLYVYVKEGVNSNNQTVFYVYLVGALTITTDEGDPGGEKVDPTPGTQNSKGEYSQMIFTNYFLRTNGTDPVDDAVLKISKTVADGYGDKTKDFEFSVTVTNPVTVKDDTKTYNAQKMNAVGTVGGVIVFTTGIPKDVTLKHGEWLSFYDLPVGSSFEVTEKATPDYTPSYLLTRSGGHAPVAVPGELGKALNIPPTYLTDNKGNPDSAAYTNTRDDLPITGISVDNLPYLVMIALVLFSLAGFVAIKARRGQRSAA